MLHGLFAVSAWRRFPAHLPVGDSFISRLCWASFRLIQTSGYYGLDPSRLLRRGRRKEAFKRDAEATRDNVWRMESRAVIGSEGASLFPCRDGTSRF